MIKQHALPPSETLREAPHGAPTAPGYVLEKPNEHGEQHPRPPERAPTVFVHKRNCAARVVLPAWGGRGSSWSYHCGHHELMLGVIIVCMTPIPARIY